MVHEFDNHCACCLPFPTLSPTQNRDNPQLYGTDREASIRQSDDPFYKRFAAECSRVQITVDVYSFSSQYIDLASLAAMPRYTCGEVRGAGVGRKQCGQVWKWKVSRMALVGVVTDWNLQGCHRRNIWCSDAFPGQRCMRGGQGFTLSTPYPTP